MVEIRVPTTNRLRPGPTGRLEGRDGAAQSRLKRRIRIANVAYDARRYPRTLGLRLITARLAQTGTDYTGLVAGRLEIYFSTFCDYERF